MKLHTPLTIALPALPDAEAMAADRKYRGITDAMDKALDKLHEHGWSLVRLFEEPRAVLPVPADRFPAGRIYVFSDDVALVVKQANGSVMASMPVAAALKTLHAMTPEVLAANAWAAARWEAIQQSPDFVPAWHEQRWLDRFGSAWTVRLIDEGALVSRNGVPMHVVADDVAAEALDLHPVLVEIVADLAAA